MVQQIIIAAGYQYLSQGDSIIGTKIIIAVGCANTCHRVTALLVPKNNSSWVHQYLPRIWQHYWYPIVLAALLPAVASNIIGILTTVVVALIAVAMVIVVPS